MTFGSQCDRRRSFAVLDRALEGGIDFFDCAEMYPAPPRTEHFGISEEILGSWMQDKPRESLTIATKVTGPAHGWFSPPVRHERTALDRHQILRAAEGSLKRLRTDYLDLYQLHWPDHGMRPEDTLSALTQLIDEGKVRAVGTSNETCWGLMKYLWAAEVHDLARFDSVQNHFSLINRRCENELAQVCRQENVSLLPYSPLGGGTLTGKYDQGHPPGARFTYYLEHGQERQKAMARRFVNERTLETTRRCEKIAHEAGLSVTTLAVAWSKQHDYVASTIIGASHPDQLDDCLKAAAIRLDDETLNRLDALEAASPNPMPEDGLRQL